MAFSYLKIKKLFCGNLTSSLKLSEFIPKIERSDFMINCLMCVCVHPLPLKKKVVIIFASIFCYLQSQHDYGLDRKKNV